MTRYVKSGNDFVEWNKQRNAFDITSLQKITAVLDSYEAKIPMP